MAVSCREVIQVLEELAPPQLAEDWDNVGLSVGNPASEIKRVLVALDVIPSVIEEAIAKKADLIVTHHPMLLFQKIRSIQANTPLGHKIYQLIEHHISAFAAHTNLDIAKGGTNDVLAKLAGLTETSLLEETSAEKLQKLVVYVPISHEEMVRKAMGDNGAGHIGRYSHCTFGAKGRGTFLPLEGTTPFLGEVGKLEEAEEIRLETIVSEKNMAAVLEAVKKVHPYEEMAYDCYAVAQKGKREGIGRIGMLEKPMTLEQYGVFLKEQLGLDTIRMVGDKTKVVQKVGLCTGSGVEFLETAKAKGADVYLTGDIKFHEAQRAIELGLPVIDVTHYGSEVLIVPVLQQYLQQKAEEKGWDIEVMCSQVNGQVFWHI